MNVSQPPVASPTGPDNQTLGALGEELAAKHILALGWDILARNWSCRDGEIDIIAKDRDTVVFIEVKTRRSTRAGHPLEAVTGPKLRTLHRLGVRWLSEQQDYFPGFRFDVVGIIIGSEPDISHAQDVR